MRRAPTPRSGHRPVVSVAALAVLAGSVAFGGCDGRPPVGPNTVRALAIELPSQALRPGQSMQAAAVATNVRGDVLSVRIVWRSLTPAVMTVDTEGTLGALAPGVGVVRATAGSISVDRQVTLVNPPATSIDIDADSVILTLPGAQVALQVVATDAAGVRLVGERIRLESEATRIATISEAGVVTPVAVGRTFIVAELDGVRATRIVRVDPLVTATSPVVSAIGTALITPGQAFTITGTGFSPTIPQNGVRVDGIPAAVIAASETQLTVVLPSTGLPCAPTADVAVQVNTAGGVGAARARLRTAPQRDLAPGQALVFSSAAAASCNEFAAGGGRYLLAVQHAGRTLGAGPVAVTIEGRSGVSDLGTMAVGLAELAVTAHSPRRAIGDRRADHHLRILESSRVLAATTLAASAPRAASALQLPPTGGVVSVRVPNLDATNFCVDFITIGARAVFAGERIVILEDTLSVLNGLPTLAGTMDADLVALGQEVESVTWPIITQFGDPLVMDSRLDDNGRVAIVITPAMNGIAGGEVLGAVVTCDFFPRAQLPSSNVGEVMYLQAPRSPAAGFAPGTRARWRHDIRGTIAHELKHIVGFAERIVRGQPLEESWLEEATARHAEERYARAITGATPTGNAGYETIRCEVRALLGAPECEDYPRMMLPHLEGLWQFLDSPAVRSPLGPVVGGDLSFYGSGWSVLRWAMDHAAIPEAQFLQNLTTSGQSGVANLEARAARSWDDILARWSLALMTDGRAGREPGEPTLRFPSWNLGDLFAGVCGDLGPCAAGAGAHALFTRPDPLRPVLADAPIFTIGVPEIVSGGFVAVEVAPDALDSRRLIRLRGFGGATLPAIIRLAILRIE